MTNLTNHIAADDDNLIGSFLASLPTIADMLEATAVLSVGALLTACLNLML
ncbi:hypothetical protein [Niveispirillum sp. KHB5.9]|uniref:hypothetical protein n=1 Tax=Niveispirillum sp. KHB5.9 TaxID=3400269 RepID=UPI003A87CE95